MTEIEKLFIALRRRLLAENPKIEEAPWEMLNITLKNLGETITAFKTYENLTHSDPAIREIARSFAAEYGVNI